MGLKVHLRPGETHALFDDETYAKSQEWKLSTSGLNAGGRFMGTGFGAAWPDGYGINCTRQTFACFSVIADKNDRSCWSAPRQVRDREQDVMRGDLDGQIQASHRAESAGYAAGRRDGSEGGDGEVVREDCIAWWDIRIVGSTLMHLEPSFI